MSVWAWLLLVGGVVPGLGCAEGDLQSFRVATFNAGLAGGYVAHAAERAPAVARALSRYDAELICLQEVWTGADQERVLAAAGDRFAHTLFPAPMADEQAGAPACTTSERELILACVEESCAEVETDQLAGCALKYCADISEQISQPCQLCIVSQVGRSLLEIDSACASGGGRWAYEGSFGIGLLSRLPILSADLLVLESTVVRRAVIHAELRTPAGADLHLFCTHLTALLSSTIPYPGDAGSWEEEQRDQIQALSGFVDQKVGDFGGGAVLVLGDMNCGPSGGGFGAEAPSNYEALRAAMDGGFYADLPGARCTFCGDNPLVAREGASVLIDHVLQRSFAGVFDARRIFIDPIRIRVDGRDQTSALSDHYGVQVDLHEPGQ